MKLTAEQIARNKMIKDIKNFAEILYKDNKEGLETTNIEVYLKHLVSNL